MPDIIGICLVVIIAFLKGVSVGRDLERRRGGMDA